MSTKEKVLDSLSEGSTPPFPPPQLAKGLCQIRLAIRTQVITASNVHAATALFLPLTSEVFPLERQEPSLDLAEIALGLASKLEALGGDVEAFPLSAGWWRETMHHHFVNAAIRYRHLEKDFRPQSVSVSSEKL
jgi:hypothetical protein